MNTSFAIKTPGSVNGSNSSAASEFFGVSIRNNIGSTSRYIYDKNTPLIYANESIKGNIHANQKYSSRVMAHGAFSVIKPYDDQPVVSGRKAAIDYSKKIQKNEKVIFLQSCSSANGGIISNAQMFANETGCTVFGYKGKVSDRSGIEKKFKPQSKIIADITGFVNDNIGKFIAKKYNK